MDDVDEDDEIQCKYLAYQQKKTLIERIHSKDVWRKEQSDFFPAVISNLFRAGRRSH